MSVRMATEQDLPRILEIYAPYIETTVCSFEYSPGWSGRKTARFWAMPTEVYLLNGQLISGAQRHPFTCVRKPRVRVLAENYTPHWKNCCRNRVIRRFLPSSPLPTKRPLPSIGRWVTATSPPCRTAALNLAPGTAPFGWIRSSTPGTPRPGNRSLYNSFYKG